jgi:hypothetical protein
VSPATLLDQLQHAGIRLGCDEDTLHADVLPGVDLSKQLEIITQCKEVLLAELHLRGHIAAVAAIEPDAFNRHAYDELWARWYCLQAQEITPCGLTGGSLRRPDVGVIPAEPQTPVQSQAYLLNQLS